MSDGRKPRVAFFVGTKGRGSNMACLVTACLSGDITAIPSLVISPKDKTPAVIRAESLLVPVAVVQKGDDYRARLLSALSDAEIDYICLTGYMFLLPVEIVQKYEGRILNIHPALLPKYGGKGMYGKHVHEAVLAAGDTESGCSVHVVTEQYDEGQVVLQKRCPVLPGDTVETLAERVLGLEHTAYAEALKKVIEEG